MNHDEAHHALAKRDWNSKNHRYNSSNEHRENLESKDAIACSKFRDQLLILMEYLSKDR